MDEFCNKHYIRIDTKYRIIKGFSDAFERPTGEDVCINEQGERLFEMLGVVNPQLTIQPNIYRYKYVDDIILERTADEIQTDIAKIIVPVSEADLLKAQVQAMAERNEFLENCVAEIAMKVY